LIERRVEDHVSRADLDGYRTCEEHAKNVIDDSFRLGPIQLILHQHRHQITILTLPKVGISQTFFHKTPEKVPETLYIPNEQLVQRSELVLQIRLSEQQHMQLFDAGTIVFHQLVKVVHRLDFSHRAVTVLVVKLYVIMLTPANCKLDDNLSLERLEEFPQIESTLLLILSNVLHSYFLDILHHLSDLVLE